MKFKIETMERYLGIQRYSAFSFRDTFEHFEWNFRVIGIQRFLDFGDTFSNCYIILGILFKISAGIQAIGDPLSGPQNSLVSILCKKLTESLLTSLLHFG